jgi:hypothetical protein
VAKVNVDELIAQKLFGWKWVAFAGVPIRGTEGYPNKTMVRQFCSPLYVEKLQDMLEVRDADMNEPLSYRYCSSLGPECVPQFHQALEMVVELELTPGWSEIKDEVMSIVNKERKVVENGKS